MTDRDFDPKDGEYIMVMNQFVDKLITYPLDSNEWRIIMLIIRRTWGVKGRPWVDLRWKAIIEATGLKDSSLTKAMRKLRLRNIIHHLENSQQITRYKINSKVSTWKNPTELTATQGGKSGDNLPPSKAVITATQGGKSGNLPPSKAVVPLKTIIKDSLKDTPKAPTGEKPPKIDKYGSDAKMVVDYINELSGKKFKHTQGNLAPIKGRLREAYTIEQCLQVCLKKWEDPDFDSKYFRPTTLFRPSLFDGYLNENGTKHKLSKQKAKMRSTVEAFARRHHARNSR